MVFDRVKSIISGTLSFAAFVILAFSLLMFIDSADNQFLFPVAFGLSFMFCIYKDGIYSLTNLITGAVLVIVGISATVVESKTFLNIIRIVYSLAFIFLFIKMIIQTKLDYFDEEDGFVAVLCYSCMFSFLFTGVGLLFKIKAILIVAIVLCFISSIVCLVRGVKGDLTEGDDWFD